MTPVLFAIVLITLVLGIFIAAFVYARPWESSRYALPVPPPRRKPPPPLPTIVCLCGSTRFWRTFQQASLDETMAGRIVLSIGAASGTDDEHFGNLPRDEYNRIKTMLDELHLRKIDLADEVLILNCGGYIGESTARELAYARKLGKVVRFLEPER
jgi:hypothetical protein